LILLALVIADGDLNQIKATGSGGADSREIQFSLMEKFFTTNDMHAFYKRVFYNGNC
jgi:hypothetical protein